MPPIANARWPNSAQRHQRLRAAPLVDDEADHRDALQAEQGQAEVARRAVQVHHAVEQREDGDAISAEAEHIEPAAVRG